MRVLRAGVWPRGLSTRPPTPCAASRRSRLRTESSVRHNRTSRSTKCLLPGSFEGIRTRDPDLGKVEFLVLGGLPESPTVQFRPPSFHLVHSIRRCRRAFHYGLTLGDGKPSAPTAKVVRVRCGVQCTRAGTARRSLLAPPSLATRRSPGRTPAWISSEPGSRRPGSD